MNQGITISETALIWVLICIAFCTVVFSITAYNTLSLGHEEKMMQINPKHKQEAQQ